MYNADVHEVAPKKLSPVTWGIYDLANSLASIAVAFYFSLFVVKELGYADLWVSVPVAFSTILLLLTLPFFGAVADRMRRYKPALTVTTLLAIAALAGMGFAAQWAGEYQVWFWVLIASYLVFQYAFQAALAFYMPYLQEIARRHSREVTASVGHAAGQVGNVAGLLIAFPLASGAVVWAGLSGTPLVFLVAALLFLLGYLIFASRFREDAMSSGAVEHFLPKSFAEFIQQFRGLRGEPNVLRYLIVYYLFADAILTLQLFLSLYLDVVGGLTTGLKTATFVFGLLAAIFGSLLTPWFIRRVGNLKKAQLRVLATWSVLLVLLALAREPAHFIAIATLNGFAFGALFSISRIMYSKLIPVDQPARYFGIYVVFERFASILGPLVWSLVTLAFAFSGPTMKYRLALGSLGLIVALAFVLLRGVREEYRS